MHTHIHIYIHTYTYIYTYIHTYTYIYINTHKYIFTRKHRNVYSDYFMDWMARSLISGKGKTFASYPQLPDRLWGPSSFLFNDHGGSFPSGRDVKLITAFLLVPRLITCWVMPLRPFYVFKEWIRKTSYFYISWATSDIGYWLEVCSSTVVFYVSFICEFMIYLATPYAVLLEWLLNIWKR